MQTLREESEMLGGGSKSRVSETSLRKEEMRTQNPRVTRYKNIAFIFPL